MPGPLWHDNAGVARLDAAGIAATLDPRHPSRGLHRLRLDNAAIEDLEILGVAATSVVTPSEPSDCYVRGADLVVTYDHVPHDEMRTEIYWRVRADLGDQALACLELQVSVQTDLLDSRPQLTAQSHFVGGELVRWPGTGAERCARGFLWRPAGTLWSYAEMVHPADPGWSETHASAGAAGSSTNVWSLRHHLFAAALEKGVILRARVLGVLLAREGDEQAAQRLYAAFVAQSPPLTR